MSANLVDMGLVDLAIREVVEVHAFFCAWLRPDPDPSLDPTRFERGFAPEFRLVGPDGQVRDRATVVAWLHQLHGGRAHFRMQVSDFRAVWREGDAVLLEYVETQYLQEKTTRRQSTALLKRDASAPIGIAWVHLQETWLQAVE